MKTRKISKNVYICENCGAEYSDKHKIMVDKAFGTDQEYCPKCAKKVLLSNTDIFGIDYISDDIGCSHVDVPPNVVKVTDLDLELDYYEYKDRIYKAMLLYADVIRRIHRDYLAGKVRDLKIPTVDEILK